MRHEIFEIDPDIEKARTLGADFYRNEEFFELSKEKIFARSWHPVGRVSEIENIQPYVLLEDFLDEPIVLTKTQGGEIRCLSNVCTHRAKILVESACRGEGLRCPYHGRRFDLEGRFLSMPEFEAAKNFPTEADDLKRIGVRIWNGFVFVSLGPLAPLEEFLAETEALTGDFDFENLEFSSGTDYLVRCHWALYCENYLEGFHIPFVHDSLNEEIVYGNYSTETFRWASLQTAFDKRGEIAARYFFIFPNLMLNFYPWGISINIVKPLKKNLTKISYLTFVSDAARLGQGAGADLETVEFEDQKIVESVQKGINSRFYDSGRFSPERERGVHHFQKMLAEVFKAGESC